VLPLLRFADRTRAIADTGLDLVGVVEGARVDALASFDSIYSWYGTNRAEFRDAVKHLPFTFFPALPGPEAGRGPGGPPYISVRAQARGEFVVIHPFASALSKRWPIENFREVGARLDVPVQWCAGPEEALEDAVRIEDLYELACWLSTARLYIGNDSGIAHLAAAVGTPVIAIFIASDAQVWAPRGAHVRVLERPGVEQVLAAAGLILGRLQVG
jgi:hypothetical protein